MVQDSPEQSRWRNAFRAMMDDVPDSFKARQEQYLRMSDVFHEELALRLEQPLNAHLKSCSASSLTQGLVDDIGKQLSQLHLAPRCPISGRPARLMADSPGTDKTHQGRFGFSVNDENGQPHRTFSQRSLPAIELMLDDPSRSPAFVAHSQKPSGPGKGR